MEKNEFRVYARRHKPEKGTKHSTPLTHDQEFELSPKLIEIHSGKGTFDLENVQPVIDDLNIPIALRKGVRTCTNHPISNFCSYEGLSPPYQAFVLALDSVQVPKWRKAVSEEIGALEKKWPLGNLRTSFWKETCWL